MPVEIDPDRGVDRPVADLASRIFTTPQEPAGTVDEDRGVDLLQRPRPPGVHLLDHPIGDPADRVLEDRGAVDVGELSGDFAGR